MVETSAKNGILTVEHPLTPKKLSLHESFAAYQNWAVCQSGTVLVRSPPSKQPAGKRHQLAFRFRLGILLGLFFLANGGLHSLLGSLARLRFCFLALLGLFSLGFGWKLTEVGDVMVSMKEVSGWFFHNMAEFLIFKEIEEEILQILDDVYNFILKQHSRCRHFVQQIFFSTIEGCSKLKNPTPDC